MSEESRESTKIPNRAQKLTENIYVCRSGLLTETLYPADARALEELLSDTEFIINVGPRLNKINPGAKKAECWDYALSNQELVPTEYQKILSKLESICTDMQGMLNCGGKMIIVCETGLNRAMLVALYYIFTRGLQVSDGVDVRGLCEKNTAMLSCFRCMLRAVAPRAS